MNNSTIKIISSLFAVALLTAPSTVFATDPDKDTKWFFDCNQPSITQVKKPKTPNIYIVQDISGSMRESEKQPDGTYLQRFNIAKNGIIALLNANLREKIANYGLGEFSSYFSDKYVCAADSTQTILRYVSQMWLAYRFKGGTNMGRALTGALNSNCHKNREQSQSSATLFITDGIPSDGHNSIVAACIHAKTAPVYVVGLGTDTSLSFNNMLAAAGQTGTCNSMDPCDPRLIHLIQLGQSRTWKQEIEYLDIIDKLQKDNCTGALNVSNTKELTDTLKGIVQNMSCTFPLESVANISEVKHDPNNEYPWVDIKIQQQGKPEPTPVPYQNSTTRKIPGWDWSFASADRKTIKLGSIACQTLREAVPSKGFSQAESVSTLLGCQCLKTEGSKCDTINWSIPGVCPEGTWTCDRGKDVCNTPPDTTKECNISSEEPTHCGKGVYQCNRDTGQVRCISTAVPMPEVCNGYDDDCDGVKDNMRISWETPIFDAFMDTNLQRGQQLTEKTESQTCDYTDSCENCTTPNTIQVHADGITFTPATFTTFINNWGSTAGTCNCSGN